MYRVLTAFVDGENGKAWPPDKGGHSYAVGDTYPKGGFEPSESHIAYLLSGGLWKKPVIAPVEEDAPKEEQPKKRTRKAKEPEVEE